MAAIHITDSQRLTHSLHQNDTTIISGHGTAPCAGLFFYTPNASPRASILTAFYAAEICISEIS